MVQRDIKSTQLNLARKWRSLVFDEIVGQEILVKILKNSLYKNYFLPVYLFSGQKGCGKTTTARVFAAAANCDSLALFQKSPKDHTIPCLLCYSCTLFSAGKHPDFIEMDAASHTGVDNVRNIIDAAGLLPVVGRKKIYLIDEAHMLSKAAFNALLKILEEPPQSVFFILATTDPERVLETVRSRCFHVFFKPIDAAVIFKHISVICHQEGIEIDDNALMVLIEQSHGSMRDALNLLEQVRFAHKRITKDTINTVLGYINDDVIVRLIDCLVQGNIDALLSIIKEKKLYNNNAFYLWHRIVLMLRVCIWLKNRVSPPYLVEYHPTLKAITGYALSRLLQGALEQFYRYELIFYKASDQYGLLELVLLRICQQNVDIKTESNIPTAAVCAAIPDKPDFDQKSLSSFDWNDFLQEIIEKKDSLVSSVFKQACGGQFDADRKVLRITFAEKFIFFKELLDQTSAVWKLSVEQFFGVGTTVDFLFNEQHEATILSPKQAFSVVKEQKVHPVGSDNEKYITQAKQVTKLPSHNRNQKIYLGRPEMITAGIDVTNEKDWPQANFLQKYFAGTVREIIKFS